MREGNRLRVGGGERLGVGEGNGLIVEVSEPWQVRALGQATAWSEVLKEGEPKAVRKARGEA